MEFVPVDYDYFDFEGRNYVRLVGRDEKGRKVCVVDDYEPNFWVILKEGFEKDAEKLASDIEKISVEKAGRATKVERVEVLDKKFLGKPVKAIRVFVTNHKDVHEIASEIGDREEIAHRREHDLSILSKYIKEKGVDPLKWYDVEGDPVGADDFGGLANAIELDVCISAKKISPLKTGRKFIPKILAYDIETSDSELGKGEVLMISLCGNGVKKVLTWKKCDDVQDYVEIVEDEAAMIERFVELVKKNDPDILTGYFSDGFDLPYLKGASERDGVKLSLGIDGTKPTFTRGRIPSGRIAGIVHVDLFRFIDAVFSQYLQSETLSLNEVAKELVGEEKEDFDFNKLARMTDSDWRDFFSYNLQDSAVTHKLAEKIWPDIFEFAHVIKEPLFDVTRDRMSAHVENYIYHNLDRFDEIAEKRPGYSESGERKAMGKYGGADVLEPTPGFYENIAVFDFTSMHSSIIVSFNLSKSTLLESKTKDASVTPEFDLDGKKKRFYFSKELGFFPKLLFEVFNLRKKYKKEYAKDKSPLAKARSNAYKLLANASYGYQAFFGARYYCREAAASTLAFVNDFTSKSMEAIRAEGYEVIFSDTDSVGFVVGDKSREDVLKMLKKINSGLPGIMELDLEDFYKRGLFVAKRGKIGGAKKKYAMLDENDKMKIRGFETVRRDWCKLTRNLQNEVLNKILHEGNERSALDLLIGVVKRLKDRQVDLDDLMIRTQLRKPLNEYLAQGPHVVAAKKMLDQEIPVSVGMLIRYYIGEGSGKRIGDRVFLPDEKAKYDIDYYLKNQILPAVENIFDVFGVNVSDVASGSKQQKLF